MSKLLEFCSALLLLGAVHHADALVSVAHTLRECPREKSENLGIIANLKACRSCHDKTGKKLRGKNRPEECSLKNCDEPVEVVDLQEGMFIDEEYIKCNSGRSDMCNKRGIKGEIRFRLRKNCVMRNKAKRYDFTIHVKIPEKRALPVTTKTTIKVHGLPENNTRAWLSPLGDEIIFNINDISWKDISVFLSKDEMDTRSDLIVRRGFSIAPLSQEKQGFQDTWLPELNFARNSSAEVIDDDESAFFVCKQDHVQENIVTVAFWHQKIFTGVVMKGHAHSITYKMAAVLGGFVLFIIMLCLTAALLTLKKQASLYSAHENEEDDGEDKEEVPEEVQQNQ
jgi:hypothetical protein